MSIEINRKSNLDEDSALAAALDNSFLADFKYSQDPASRPLPEKLIKTAPRFDPQLEEIRQACKGQVPVWSTPLPIIRHVRTQEDLNKAIDFLNKQDLVAINVFGRRIDRTCDPAFIVISCQQDDGKVLSVVFSYCKPTVERLHEIIFSRRSTKLVTGLAWLSDLLFNRLYPDQEWNVETHKIIDLCFLHLDIEKTKFLLESLDVKVTHRSQGPTLISPECLLTTVFPEIEDFSSMDYLHFPVKSRADLAKFEYRLLELDLTYATAVKNFVMRTCASHFYIFDKLNQAKDEIYNQKVQDSMIRTFQTEDDVWKRLSMQRHGNVAVYKPADIITDKSLLKVPEWKTPAFDIIWLDEENQKETLAKLQSLPAGSRVAINIYGRFVDRFTEPQYIALGTETPHSTEIIVYVIKFTYTRAIEQLFPFIMRKDTYKIVPCVNYIFDVLFKKIYANKGKIWSAEEHKIVELQSLDSLASKIELVNSNSLQVRHGRRTLEELISFYLNEPILHEHFPLLGKSGFHECYLLHLKVKGNKNQSVTRNFLARTVVTMLFLHPLILNRLHQPLNQQTTTAIKVVSRAESIEEAHKRAARLRELSPTSALKYSEELIRQETMDRISDRLFSSTSSTVSPAGSISPTGSSAPDSP